ncbi:acyloxyacyl hydrolase [Polaribacter reichenbachii]|uniref:acyloxyacyl hydrolase n=1 Tax=Polaribacter reichenbachii TaxID=996801 RepID=UPI001CFFE991|nr:acyloxyacyl hydrolase [Polaribacter reichenbachii]
MKNSLIVLLFFISFSIVSQDVKKESKLKPYKVGFLYNSATNENFLNDDPDYDYSTNTYKAQAFYKLTNWKKFDIELIVQPQIQFIKHQLINEQYVTPDIDNFLEKREEFTQQKKMNLYGVEFGFAAKRQIFKKLALQGTISLGFNYIDTRTERIAKGFTFLENFSLGISYETFSDSYLYIGTNLFGHVSNLDFNLPNAGYNILGLEIGYSFKI